MGELIRIGAEEGQPGLGATVDSHGAQVISLSMGKIHFLFPADMIMVGDEPRFRGGVPLCSPNFGRDLNGDGAQHGYARGVDWNILGKGERYVRLEHLNDDGAYKGLVHQMGIQIVDHANAQILAANLKIANGGEYDLVITPAFHPYFSGPAEFGECNPEAAVDNRVEHKGNYSIRTVRLLSGVTFKMVAVNLPSSTVWSDVPEEFHCVEPSVLPLGAEPRPEDILKPGDFKEYAVSFVLNSSENPS